MKVHFRLLWQSGGQRPRAGGVTPWSLSLIAPLSSVRGFFLVVRDGCLVSSHHILTPARRNEGMASPFFVRARFRSCIQNCQNHWCTGNPNHIWLYPSSHNSATSSTRSEGHCGCTIWKPWVSLLRRNSASTEGELQVSLLYPDV